MNRMKAAIAGVVGIAFVLAATLSIAGWVKDYRFSVSVGQQLKRALDAPTADLAILALDTAIAECKRTKRDTGNSGIFLKTPENDVGYWFTRLTEARASLSAVTPNTVEESNALMKLRETLSDSTSSGGTSLNLPANMESSLCLNDPQRRTVKEMTCPSREGRRGGSSIGRTPADARALQTAKCGFDSRPPH